MAIDHPNAPSKRFFIYFPLKELNLLPFKRCRGGNTASHSPRLTPRTA
ncbi:hypothetical protein [Nevskia sp.]|nr:hypothetical protein [Nevskia sp.]